MTSSVNLESCLWVVERGGRRVDVEDATADVSPEAPMRAFVSAPVSVVERMLQYYCISPSAVATAIAEVAALLNQVAGSVVCTHAAPYWCAPILLASCREAGCTFSAAKQDEAHDTAVYVTDAPSHRDDLFGTVTLVAEEVHPAGADMPQPSSPPQQHMSSITAILHLYRPARSEPTQHQPEPYLYRVPTSGTSGAPKTVSGTYTTIATVINDIQQYAELSSDDVIAVMSPPTFDPHVLDVFLALRTGASLVLLHPSIPMAGDLLLEAFTALRVTYACMVTTVFTELLQSQSTPAAPAVGDGTSAFPPPSCHLRHLFVGGEMFPSPTALLPAWNWSHRCRLWNIYGITERAVWQLLCPVTRPVVERCISINTALPIGFPLPSVKTQLNDKGVLFVGGEYRSCLVSDNNNNNNNTPPSTHHGLWSTGDVCARVADAELLRRLLAAARTTRPFFQILGRSDDMVKVRGKRVWLDAVARWLKVHWPNTRHAACLRYQTAGSVACRHRLVGVCATGTEAPHSAAATAIAAASNEHVVTDAALSALNRRLRETFGVDVDAIVTTPTLTTTSHGKSWTLLRAKEVLQCAMEAAGVCVPSPLVAGWGAVSFASAGGDSLAAADVCRQLEAVPGVVYTAMLHSLMNDTLDACAHKLLAMATPADHRGAGSRSDVTRSADHGAHNTANQGVWACENVTVVRTRARHPPTPTQTQTHTAADIVADPATSPAACSCHVRWTQDMGACVDASPTLHVCDDDETGAHPQRRVYIGSHAGIFACLDAASGAVLWKDTFDGRIESTACISSCGRFVAVGCYTGEVRVYGAVTGERWFSTALPDAVRSPIRYDLGSRLFFVACYDGRLYALDPNRRTCFACRHPAPTTQGGPLAAPPCLLRCLQAPGEEGERDYERTHMDTAVIEEEAAAMLRKQASSPRHGSSPVTTTTTSTSTSSSSRRGTMTLCITASLRGHVTCFQYDYEGDGKPGAGGDGRTCTMLEHLLWRHEATHPIFAAPVALAQAGSSPPHVLICLVNGVVMCMHAVQGQLLWRFNADADVFAAPLAAVVMPLRSSSSSREDPDTSTAPAPVPSRDRDEHGNCRASAVTTTGQWLIIVCTKAGAVVALSGHGDVLWRRAVGEHSITANATIVYPSGDDDGDDDVAQVAVVTTDGHLFLLPLFREELGQRDGKRGCSRSVCQFGSHVFGTPSCVEDSMFLGTRDDTVMRCDMTRLCE
ncbi:hypothetical protein PTSG_06811 [Salpingoeca rosetta]|uniref:Uncharacterized protein n=1 Tax=Salpingoeca rosetta (strain ATCC 50818 / BSB-021) TaxID=946362 RepID=F2UEV7_SALR5|nr:uncharacterized protein PTSG_06811 [Salpingoeca rosetta]EGD75157.1 hypothetical protein PTSG_06811 [Salpingoeca rosetta]|eukprot:XP_004992210.1 hypothetical protein PTSG_06811 [Salpingoeca rosetta]